jgi:hypothetical protein
MTYISGSENEARLSDQTYWRDEAESGSLEWSALDRKLLGNVEGCVLLPSRFGWAAQ